MKVRLGPSLVRSLAACSAGDAGGEAEAPNPADAPLVEDAEAGLLGDGAGRRIAR